MLEISIKLTDDQVKLIAEHISINNEILNKQTLPLDEQFLSISQVARLTNQSNTTITNHIKKGLLSAKQAGKKWLISRQALKKYTNGE